MDQTKIVRRESRGLVFYVEPNGAGVVDEVVDNDCYHIADVAPGSTVIDVGANVGTFSLMCAQRGCTVYAFEASKRNYDLLLLNLKQNANGSLVHPFNVGVVGFSGIREFGERKDHPAGSGFGLPPEIERVDRQVVCISLTMVLRDIVGVDLVLKMDCEGSEKEIFQETPLSMMHDKVKYLAMEWHAHDGYYYSERLEKAGYGTYLCGGGFPPPAYDRSIGGGMLYAWRK